jgi:hypothetical protein
MVDVRLARVEHASGTREASERGGELVRLSRRGRSSGGLIVASVLDGDDQCGQRAQPREECRIIWST